MENPRSGAGADGAAAAGAAWTWRGQQSDGGPAAHALHASGEHGTPRTPRTPRTPGTDHDDDWATTSGGARTPTDSSWDQQEHDHREPTREEQEQARFRRRYKPRTCRICLETVRPTFQFNGEADEHHEHEPDGLEGLVGADVDGLGGLGPAVAGIRSRVFEKITSWLPPFLQPAAISSSFSSMAGGHSCRVKYVSENPEDGRLISPCHCKGTQKYVHEGCVQMWRHAQPLAERNFWKCPTCGFEYRIERLRWGRLVAHPLTRVLLTVVAFVSALFVLGFIADPLMDFFLDPGGTLIEKVAGFSASDVHDSPILSGIGDIIHPPRGREYGAAADDVDVGGGWLEHLFKGLCSLGVVGVVKTFLAVSPFTWWNLRAAGLGRTRRRAAGSRQQLDAMGMVYILVGSLTILTATWKGIRYLSGRVLDRASERIVDVGGGGPDVDDDEDDVSDDDHPHRE